MVALSLDGAFLVSLLVNLGLVDIFNFVFGPAIEALSRQFNEPAIYKHTDILRVLVLVPVMIYASYRDIKERIVRDHVWVPLLVVGILLLIVDFLQGNPRTLAPWVLSNLIFAGVVGVLLFRTHMFGGADMKALIAIAVCLPTYPMLVVFPRVLPPVLASPQNVLNLFILTILANTALIAVFYPVVTLARNVRAGQFNPRRPGLMLTANHLPLDSICTYHGRVLPIWSFNSDGLKNRFTSLIQTVIYGVDTRFLEEYRDWHRDVADDETLDLSEIERTYLDRFLESEANLDSEGNAIWRTHDTEEAEDALREILQHEHVWMTPGIPFIVPLTLGLLIALTFGDLIYWVLLLFN